jgi:hypothetical protein
MTKEGTYIASKYFDVGEDDQDKVILFPDNDDGFAQFLAATVGDLEWGQNQQVRDRSKLSLAITLSNVLKIHAVELTTKAIYQQLSDESQTNEDAAEAMAKNAAFPT